MPTRGGRAKLWIGPAGWSYADWHGIVYPERKPGTFNELAFIARYFDTVEVNSTFYRVPSARMTERWPDRVGDGFRFTCKLTRDFTHDPQTAPSRALAAEFRAGIEPLRAAGKLGPLLIQFPWSFRFGKESVDRLHRLAGLFEEYERVIEVRHASWATDEAVAALTRYGGICAVDQPRLRDCLAPSALVAGRVGYVRLHGRNAANWFREDQPSFERYNYLYDEGELREWVERLNAMQAEADHVYVIANNHYRGQGPANALELRALLENRAVSVPEDLLRTFPHLKRIAEPPAQGNLF